ncbi:hypothetical protein ABS71_12555 [bacterium SCN 62-11]|nr:MAG: hypothetical protein ABS71_12555 [bacterium SCN 62-11]
MLSALLWALVTFAPNGGAGGDAWGSLLTAQALVEHGSFDLAPYTDRAAYNEAQFFRHGQALYYGYPPGGSLLEVPLVALARLLGMDMTQVAQESFMERQVSGICMIAMLGALWVGLSALLEKRRALVAAGLVLLASTYTGSIASSMANSQMPEIVFLTWTQAWMLRFDRQGGRLNGWLLGLFLGAAYWCRPTALLWAPFVCLYLWLRKREALVGAVLTLLVFVLGFKLALGPFWGGSHPYYGSRPLVSDFATFSLEWVGVLFSPGVGLFVYQPLLLPPFLLAPVLLRRQPLAWMLFLYANAHIVVVALQRTWMTVAFGPRLLAEACFPLWFLAAMLAPQLRLLIWPALLWSLWLNTYLAFFCQTQHLHYTATRPEQDPTTRGLWEWRLAPFLVTQDQLWEQIRLAPPELFPALNNPLRRNFQEPEQAGDQPLVRPLDGPASVSFRSQAPPGPSSGLVCVRYSSPLPVSVELNGRLLPSLPASRATRRQTLAFQDVEWRPENEVRFSAGPEFRLFDLVAEPSPADQPGIVAFVEGFSGDEGGTRWAYGPSSRALLVARKAGRVDLDFEALNPHPKLDVQVWCNRRHLANFHNLPEGEAQLRIPLTVRAGDNELEFRFNHWGIKRARDQRPLALRLSKLSLNYSGL